MRRVDLQPKASSSSSGANSSCRADPARHQSSFISKSKFLWGLQCHKLLWHAYNAKHLIPERDAQTQAIFDQGHEVGQLAKYLFPGGIEVGHGIDNFDAILAATTQAVKHRRPLYE